MQKAKAISFVSRQRETPWVEVTDLVFTDTLADRESAEKMRRWNIYYPQKRRRYDVDIVDVQQLLPSLLEMCGLWKRVFGEMRRLNVRNFNVNVSHENSVGYPTLEQVTFSFSLPFL